MQPPGHNAHPAALCQTTACERQAGATERGGENVSLSAADAAQEEGTKTPAESQTTSLWRRAKLQRGAIGFMK